jgi:vancomycin resistance protein YoaR
VLQPGEQFNANKIMGPYRPSKGYKQAGVLTEGRTKLGYGGGTCQVSSTLYNVLIQLPHIEINHRRPHGGNGASYLPIHCDAAVGNPELNLIFTNRYDFPIRIQGTSNDDGALLMRIYRYHE